MTPDGERCPWFELEGALRLESGLPLGPHADTCAECRAACARYERLARAIPAAYEAVVPPPSPGFERRLQKLVAGLLASLVLLCRPRATLAAAFAGAMATAGALSMGATPEVELHASVDAAAIPVARPAQPTPASPTTPEPLSASAAAEAPPMPIEAAPPARDQAAPLRPRALRAHRAAPIPDGTDNVAALMRRGSCLGVDPAGFQACSPARR